MPDCNPKLSCSDDRNLLFEKNGYLIWNCNEHSYRYAQIDNKANHVSKVYNDDYFFKSNAGYPNYLDEKDILYKHGVYCAKLINKYTKPGSVLDVGCAAGFILKGFEDMGWKCTGIEPNATMGSYGRNELYLDIKTGSFEDFVTDQRFNMVSLIQVISHFYDIEKAIENISKLLQPNGIVFVESWNMDSITARLFGKHWHAYNPPSVINWFSDKSLIKFFKNNKFDLIDSGYPFKQLNLKHAISILEKSPPISLINRKILDSLKNSFGNIVINYPPIDLKWYIFRKQ